MVRKARYESKEGACPCYWDFRGIIFPCDLPLNHHGPHLNYPKEDGHDAVIIWSNREES